MACLNTLEHRLELGQLEKGARILRGACFMKELKAAKEILMSDFTEIQNSSSEITGVSCQRAELNLGARADT